MTLPIADTPLDDRLVMPARRSDAWNPAIEPALYRAAGQDAVLARLARERSEDFRQLAEQLETQAQRKRS